MLGRSSVEAMGLRFWRPFDVQHRDAVNLSLRPQSDALGKRWGRLGICRARQILVSGQTCKSLWGFESSSWTQPPERHNDETWKGLGNVTVFCVQRHCVLARTHARCHVGPRKCRSASMPQPDPCRQLRVPECLVKADSCGCGTEESRAVKGAPWVHGICKCMQVLTVWDIKFTFLPRPTAQENEVLKFPDLREEDAACVGFRSWVCTHTWCSMWKSVSYQPDRKRHTTLRNSWQFVWQAQRIWWKVFSPKLDNIQECLANLSSFQPITSFLPWRGGACRNAHTAGVKE